MTATTTTVEQASEQPGEEVRQGTDWVDEKFPTTEGTPLPKRHPKNKVTVLARPGMIVDACDDWGPGIIEMVTTDFAIVRFEDGSPGAYRWGEVSLDAVGPDPACIARAPENGGLKLGAEASKVALLARRLASVIDELGFMEAKGELTTADEFGKLVEELEKPYRKLWQLSGEEMLLSDELSNPAP